MSELLSSNFMMEVDVVSDTNVTLASVEVLNARLDGGVIQGVGSSKRSPEDPYDELAGSYVAGGRALVDLGEKLIREGHKRSHEARRAAEREANEVFYQIELEKTLVKEELRRRFQRGVVSSSQDVRANHPTSLAKSVSPPDHEFERLHTEEREIIRRFEEKSQDAVQAHWDDFYTNDFGQAKRVSRPRRISKMLFGF